MLTAIVARAQDGIYVTIPGREGPRIAYVNPAMLQLTGYTAAALVGRSPALLHGPDTDRLAIQHLHRAVEAGTGARADLVLYAHGGVPCWVEVMAAPVPGSQGQAVWIHRDVTQRKAAEHAFEASQARYQALSRLIAAYAFAYRVGPEGRLELEWLTETVRDVLGFSPTEMQQRPLESLVHPDDLPRWRERNRRVLAGEELRSEVRLRTRAGAYRWVRVYVYPEWNETGDAVTRVYGAAQDVDDQKEAEATLVAAKEQAEEMARLKDTFLANMSHEIRTPLTGILGFAEILQYELGDEHQELIGMIQSGGRRLMDTLTSVLELSRLRAQRVTLDLQPVDVAALTCETVALFGPQAALGGNILTAEGCDTPLMARADRPALERVLSNLISNALKFTEQGGVRVVAGRELGGLVVRVTDTGPGIDEAFLPHLFDEFRQESTGLARSHEGAGLGLAITKRLVELMGGSIGVDSEKGVGTTFLLWLPAA